ncbi:MAG: GGDEF domain-containing protein, partial [Spirochaetes bacterium]|nr:GGDEF domain-containing protein [Spirochaetota bacterium]
DNRLVSGLFTQENLRVLEVLAKQAGISISNAILYKRAITDGLTGLYNHNFFQNYLMKSTERANRFNNELSLLMIDIDHFKECNDTYGHRAGDEVLHNVSEILQKTARRSDLVARYGGEEFAIILPETGLEGARIAAEKIREAIETSRVKTKVGKKDEEIQVTVSVGVAELEPGEEPISLIERSDQALYKAKERGRNCVKVFGEKKGTTAGRKKITQKSRKAVTKSKIQRSRRKKK